MDNDGTPTPVLRSDDLATEGPPAYQDQYLTNYNYGSKIAGLVILPSQWVPPFIAVPTRFYDLWINENQTINPILWKDHGLDLSDARRQTSSGGKFPTIIRSSVVGEGLDERGYYKSIAVSADKSDKEFFQAINSIYSDYNDRRQHYLGMGLCIQRYIEPEIIGHTSNEVRLSPTRNQWRFEIEKPYSPSNGINSIYAESPRETTALRATADNLDSALRRLCHWLNERVAERMHLEWVATNGFLWVVQLDREPPTSDGVDPNIAPPGIEAPDSGTVLKDGIFRLYSIGTSVPWRKLRNVDDFWINEEKPNHELFYSEAGAIANSLSTPDGQDRLAQEIDELTHGHAVLRTDCISPDVPSFFLPRTHTINGLSSISWLKSTLNSFREKGIPTDTFAFILHRYIPARAAAWSFYDPGTAWVQIDCLWGLPDGLQFLAHDSHQIDAQSGQELSANVNYKPNFLQEQPNGSWEYVRVARQFSRNRVLSQQTLRSIAEQTIKIAEKVNERAHIMWFCDLPKELGLGNHLPWYRSKEYLEPIERARPLNRKPLVIRTMADLVEAEGSSDTNIILRVEPAVELIRDDSIFLKRLIVLAKKNNIPVELSGSVLGHAYYRLVEAGLLVLTEGPAHYRSRGRNFFGKLVRDDIPANIARKGEEVTSTRVPHEFALTSLLAKLLEESFELMNAESEEDSVEELGDVYEVVRGLSVALGIPWDHIEETAKAKRATRGGFEKGVMLVKTARPKSPTLSNIPIDQNFSLEDLLRVTTDENQINIPIFRLLRKEPISVEIPYDGSTMVIEFRLAGSELISHVKSNAKEESTEKQLSLF